MSRQGKIRSSLSERIRIYAYFSGGMQFRIRSDCEPRCIVGGVHVRDEGGNNATSTTVHFTVHPGDISGDNVVNIFDLQRLAWAFMSHPGDANWNDAADLNCDSTVNIFDLQVLAWHFMNSYA